MINVFTIDKERIGIHFCPFIDFSHTYCCSLYQLHIEPRLCKVNKRQSVLGFQTFTYPSIILPDANTNLCFTIPVQNIS